jgi:xylulokinase
MRDLYLAIDVGTGGIRSALVDQNGTVLAICHQVHEQLVRQHGWSEQRPEDWWQGTIATIQDVLRKVDDAEHRVAAICCCGQMHGTVLVDDNGELTRDSVPLWNDKRAQPLVDAFNNQSATAEDHLLTGNSPSAAWPAFKLMWLSEHEPASFARTRTVLMPKDWINFKLTGQYGQDWTEASLSYLMDWKTKKWSADLQQKCQLPPELFPPISDPCEVLAGLSSSAAELLGFSVDIPVLVGAGDYPMALLGSGVVGPGMGSDVTGTSTIITLAHDTPVIESAVSNVAMVDGNWGRFTLLDAGGDAVRWARRAFHENRRSYAEVDAAATQAEVGSNALFFLPYLAGERFGEQPNSRAQFFGLSSVHGLSDLHRSVLEGVAFSVRQTLGLLQGDHGRPSRFVATGGGAKSELWLKIKASMYRTPFLVPRELEGGIVGAAVCMAVATGHRPDLKSAVDQMVQYTREIEPDPSMADVYDNMMPLFTRLYHSAQQFYDDLDRLN